MESIDKAGITGSICRLCSKMNRSVIHIYGEEGDRLQLAEKINAYLPITISVNDPLPKAVCVPCVQRLEVHHEWMEQFSWAQQRLAEAAEVERAKIGFDRLAVINWITHCERLVAASRRSACPETQDQSSGAD